MKPLDGLLVIDLSQFLSGPSAALRLADLGARVIKVERAGGGDICRSLYLTDTDVGGDSTLFHAINRNKESLALDLKDPRDLAALRRLVERADVLIQNFRPGVIERLGLGWDAAREINPRLVYAGVSGYGESGPWSGLPGQDLLAQSVSGVTWLNGNAQDGPVPLGLSVADMLAGHVLTEGILAALVRRSITGEGALVQTSLLEALIDLQFELLTTHLNDGGRLPQRAGFRNANAYLAAPYGIYPTRDGFLALAMMPLEQLAQNLPLPALREYSAADAFGKRDEIKRVIAAALARQDTAHWLARLRPADVWCAEVLDWPRLLETEAFRRLDMLQTVRRGDGTPVRTTRGPLRIDGQRARSDRGAPRVGEHSAALRTEFDLDPIGEHPA
jgi:crotonobetainyl-CoA:carnitine CoA-transferase CaiB-like acyl-CoA transferase